MELICDYREKSIIKKLNDVIQKNTKFKDMNVVSQNLPIGDFAFGNIIIERKTHQDLASSIMDGRYKEQCSRLQELCMKNPEIKVFYFIEGNFDMYFNNFHKIEKDHLYSAIMSLMYEKGFSVCLSKHMNETCDFLLKFCHKYYSKYANCNDTSKDNMIYLDDVEHEINNDVQDMSAIQKNDNLHNILQQQKKKNSQINKSNIGLLMLCNVPNISINVAQELLQPFQNNIYDFITKIKEDPDYLPNLKLQGKNNKPRKLNKTICETLKQYFCENENDTNEDTK